MFLICLLGVILAIGGLAVRHELGTILTDLRLALFGVRCRVRLPERRSDALRPADPILQLGAAPPPAVTTRPRR